MMKKRPLTINDKAFLGNGDTITIALKLMNKSSAQRAIKKLINDIYAFHLKTDGKYLYTTSTDNIKVKMIPENIKTIESAAQWSVKNNLPNYEERLATISASDEMIVFNANHSVGDGMFYVDLINNFSLPEKKIDNYLTQSVDFILQEEKSKIKNFQFLSEDEELTRIEPKGCSQTQDERLKTIVSSVKDFRCYSNETKKCSQFAENMWLSYILTCNALNGQLGNTKCFTCVDIRSFLNNYIHFNAITNDKFLGMDLNSIICENSFSAFNVGFKCNNNTLLSECFCEMRNNLDSAKKDGSLMKFTFSGYFPPDFKTRDHIGIGISHLGPLYIKKPIENIYVSNLNTKEIMKGYIALLTYSVVSDSGKNDFVTHVRYGSNKVDEKQAEIIGKSISHGLKTFSPSWTVGEALSELEKFQSMA